MSRFPQSKSISAFKEDKIVHKCKVPQYISDIPNGTYSLLELWEAFTEWLKEETLEKSKNKDEQEREQELSDMLEGCMLEHMMDALQNKGASIVRVRGISGELVVVDSNE